MTRIKAKIKKKDSEIFILPKYLTKKKRIKESSCGSNLPEDNVIRTCKTFIRATKKSSSRMGTEFSYIHSFLRKLYYYNTSLASLIADPINIKFFRPFRVGFCSSTCRREETLIINSKTFFAQTILFFRSTIAAIFLLPRWWWMSTLQWCIMKYRLGSRHHNNMQMSSHGNEIFLIALYEEILLFYFYLIPRAGRMRS